MVPSSIGSTKSRLMGLAILRKSTNTSMGVSQRASSQTILLCGSYFRVPVLTSVSDRLLHGSINQIKPTSSHTAFSQYFITTERNKKKYIPRNWRIIMRINKNEEYSWLCLKGPFVSPGILCPVPSTPAVKVQWLPWELCTIMAVILGRNDYRDVCKQVGTQSLRWRFRQFEQVVYYWSNICAWQRVSWFVIYWAFSLGVLIMESYLIQNHEIEAGWNRRLGTKIITK